MRDIVDIDAELDKLDSLCQQKQHEENTPGRLLSLPCYYTTLTLSSMVFGFTAIFCFSSARKRVGQRLPVTAVSVQSPKFQYNEPVITDAAVCETLPCDIDCIVGNELFSEFEMLHHVLDLRQDSERID